MPRKGSDPKLGPVKDSKNYRHLSLYLPNPLFKKLEDLAKKNYRSVSGQAVYLLENILRKVRVGE